MHVYISVIVVHGVLVVIVFVIEFGIFVVLR